MKLVRRRLDVLLSLLVLSVYFLYLIVNVHKEIMHIYQALNIYVFCVFVRNFLMCTNKL